METWKIIPSCPAYEAGSRGSIRRRTTVGNTWAGRIIKPETNSNGYLLVCLCQDGAKEMKSVHSLVAQAFFGFRPFGHEVDHINFVRADNRVKNLRYLEASKNCKRKKKI